MREACCGTEWADAKLLREYGLRAEEVQSNPVLLEQCQRFGTYRQEIWNWHRDPMQVAASFFVCWRLLSPVTDR